MFAASRLQLRARQVLAASRLLSAGRKPPHEITPPYSGRGLRNSIKSSSSSARNNPGYTSRSAEWDAIRKSQALTAHIGKLGWQGRWQDVLVALDTAENNEQKLYINNFSAAIAALTRSKQPERALQLSVLMHSTRIQERCCYVQLTHRCNQQERAVATSSIPSC
jgi:hypothetical protein